MSLSISAAVRHAITFLFIACIGGSAAFAQPASQVVINAASADDRHTVLFVEGRNFAQHAG